MRASLLLKLANKHGDDLLAIGSLGQGVGNLLCLIEEGYVVVQAKALTGTDPKI